MAGSSPWVIYSGTAEIVLIVVLAAAAAGVVYAGFRLPLPARPAVPGRDAGAVRRLGPVRLQLAVIIGSVRAGRIAGAVSQWFGMQLDQHDEFSPDVIDLAGLTLPDCLDGTGDAAMFAKRVHAADGFVIITPEYNHGYPGALKTAIDTAREQWQAKPVGFVSYGGIAGGLRAVEQLRLVFAEVHTVTVRHVVSLHWVHDLFDGNGMLTDHRAPAAADKMLAQLAWWGRAPRNARAGEVYDG